MPELYFCSMQNTQPIANTAAGRSVVEVNLGDFLPLAEEISVIDLKGFLFKELIVREADFRQQIQTTDWSAFKDKFVCLHCSVDAVVPMWAYMLIGVSLSGIAKDVAVASPAQAGHVFQQRIIAQTDFSKYEGKRVIVKGCGEREVLPEAFAKVSFELAKVARSVMFGEACSSVPVFKKVSE